MNLNRNFVLITNTEIMVAVVSSKMDALDTARMAQIHLLLKT